MTTNSLHNLSEQIHEHGIIVSTIPVNQWLTDAEARKVSGKLVFDLTMPASLSEVLQADSNQIFTLAHIETITQATVSERMVFIPAVQQLINQHLDEYQAYCKQSQQNKLFRQFESDIETFLAQLSANQPNGIATQQVSKNITQLVMKRFYAKTIKADAVS